MQAWRAEETSLNFFYKSYCSKTFDWLVILQKCYIVMFYIYIYSVPSLHSCSYVFAGGPPDVGKMLGGEEDKKDPEEEKEKEEERQEALRQEEDERKAKHAKMEAERESLRQGIRDKVRETNRKTCITIIIYSSSHHYKLIWLCFFCGA